MKNIILTLVLFFIPLFQLMSQTLLPINELKFKATHNSYASSGHTGYILGIESGNSCPVINNPPPEQIDDYGVWGLELDFSVKSGVLTIGHDGGSGDDETWADDSWGVTVKEYLRRIKETRSFKEGYRPLFIRFGKKCWGDYNQLIPSTYSQNWYQILKSILISVFGEENIYGPKMFKANGGWLPINKIRNKIIPWVGLEYDDCKDVLNSISPIQDDDILFWGDPVERALVVDIFGHDNKFPIFWQAAINDTVHKYTLISQDLYQFDWTFEGVSPPNPIYVVSNSPDVFKIKNVYGNKCGDGTDPGDEIMIHQHGTFLLPFSTVRKSVDIALPGWTLLIKSGSFNEKLIANKILTIKADGGPVVIGKNP
jgi:hypothetical protein